MRSMTFLAGLSPGLAGVTRCRRCRGRRASTPVVQLPQSREHLHGEAQTGLNGGGDVRVAVLLEPPLEGVAQSVCPRQHQYQHPPPIARQPTNELEMQTDQGKLDCPDLLPIPPTFTTLQPLASTQDYWSNHQLYPDSHQPQTHQGNNQTHPDHTQRHLGQTNTHPVQSNTHLGFTQTHPNHHMFPVDPCGYLKHNLRPPLSHADRTLLS